MLTYQDCLALSDISEQEIEAISQHEHIPEIVALEMASYVVHSDTGKLWIKRCILVDIEEARRSGHEDRAEHLREVLKHFMAECQRNPGRE